MPSGIANLTESVRFFRTMRCLNGLDDFPIRRVYDVFPGSSSASLNVPENPQTNRVINIRRAGLPPQQMVTKPGHIHLRGRLRQ